MDLKMLMIDEVHNLLAGSYREQRRFLNMLRFLANDAIETGEERITDEAVQAWQPVWAKHAWSIPRQPMAEFR